MDEQDIDDLDDSLDFGLEQQAMTIATELNPEQIEKFMIEIEKIPSHRSPINGKTARLVFQFMEDTGCRVNETIHVRKKDLDFRTRILTVIMPKVSQHCKCSKWKNRDEYSRIKILQYADKKCVFCKGKGRWKKPQRTSFTPRLYHDLLMHCDTLRDDNSLLFPISRVSLWDWGRKAGDRAGLMVFQQKEERLIQNIFPHLFRALCSLRMTRDAKNEEYKDPLIACKLRQAPKWMHDRYAKVDVNYLIAWENRKYNV